jgi:hypothetical protein
MTEGRACTDEVYEEQARLREDELMALEAILPSTDLGQSVVLPPASGSLSWSEIWLSVPAILPGPTSIVIRSHYYSSNQQFQLENGLEDEIKCRTETTKLDGICHLPPIRLLIRLPKGYPTHSAPIIAQIVGEMFRPSHRDCQSSFAIEQPAKAGACSIIESWHSKVAEWLREALLKQWQDFQGEILYTWYEYLKESLWQELLGSGSSSDCPLFSGNSATLTFEESLVDDVGMQSDSPLATSLKSHDILSKRKEFEGERFGCGICLEEKRGGKCWKIADCAHVFCQDCLSSYLSSMIREGYVRQASACPDPECVKARVIAENKEAAAEHKTDTSTSVGAISRDELLQFVGPELVARLEDLREKALASTDPSAGYCPRPGCEKLVRGDATDIGTMYESMRMCDCGFTYCLYCNKAWHGKAPCNLLSSTALIERYQKASEGSTTRREMELRYGKANLERMILKHEEETQNREYIESNTQKCPCCSVRIEKSMGCNHMTCRSCHTHLCYRCGTRLNPSEPYRHFNTPGTPCFQKLFDVIAGGGGPPDDWGFLGAREEDMAQWEAEL